MNKSCTSLIKCIRKYFILSGVIINGRIPLITNIHIDLVSCHMAELICWFWKHFLDDSLGSSIYKISSHWQIGLFYFFLSNLDALFPVSECVGLNFKYNVKYKYKSSKSQYPRLIPHLRGKVFHLSSLSRMLVVGFCKCSSLG